MHTQKHGVTGLLHPPPHVSEGLSCLLHGVSHVLEPSTYLKDTISDVLQGLSYLLEPVPDVLQGEGCVKDRRGGDWEGDESIIITSFFAFVLKPTFF